MYKVIFFILTLLISNTTLAINHPQLDSIFNKGVLLYQKNEMNLALDAFEEITLKGFESAELYNNIGRIYFKKKKISKSIWYFERALKLNPSNKNIIQNLDLSKQKAKINSEYSINDSSNTYSYLITSSVLTTDYWAILALILILICVFFYILYHLKSKNNYLTTAIISGFLALISFGISYLQNNYETDVDLGIILNKNAVLQLEPNPNSNKILELNKGTKIKIIEQKNDWFKVELNNKTMGWTKAQIGFI